MAEISGKIKGSTELMKQLAGMDARPLLPFGMGLRFGAPKKGARPRPPVHPPQGRTHDAAAEPSQVKAPAKGAGGGPPAGGGPQEQWIERFAVQLRSFIACHQISRQLAQQLYIRH